MPISRSQQRVLDTQVGKIKGGSGSLTFFTMALSYRTKKPLDNNNDIALLYVMSLYLQYNPTEYADSSLLRTTATCFLRNQQVLFKKSGFRCIQFSSTSASDLFRNLKSARSCRFFCGLSVRKRPRAGVVA